MVTDAGTVATAVFDELSATDVSATRRWFVSADIRPFVPATTFCDGGVSDSVGTGIRMAPLFNVSVLGEVSVVVPPWLLSCVVDGSSVRLMDVPGVAEDESWKTRCATWSPAPGALE